MFAIRGSGWTAEELLCFQIKAANVPLLERTRTSTLRRLLSKKWTNFGQRCQQNRPFLFPVLRGGSLNLDNTFTPKTNVEHVHKLIINARSFLTLLSGFRSTCIHNLLFFFHRLGSRSFFTVVKLLKLYGGTFVCYENGVSVCVEKQSYRLLKLIKAVRKEILCLINRLFPVWRRGWRC